MGLPVAPGQPGEEAAEMVADEVRRLADDVGVPKGLASLGVSETDVPRLARFTLADACLSTNPRPADVADIEALFRAAL
jgi:alcohol dehydrogenase class IV